MDTRPTPTRPDSGSRFVVDLGDVRLPSLAEKAIEADIQAVVLRHLARREDAGISRLSQDVIDDFPDGTMGLVIRDGDLPGEDDDLRLQDVLLGPDEPLGIEDHTRVMEAVMDNIFTVLHHLGPEREAEQPDGGLVLQAALRTEGIEDRVKDRIKLMLDALPALRRAERELPASVRRAATEIERRTSFQSAAERIGTLRQAARQEDPVIQAGMDVAARIVEDGQSSIYAPDHPFNRMLEEKTPGVAQRVNVGLIVNIDQGGAYAGGAAGAAIGKGGGLVGAGAGAAAGGAVGGAAASAGASAAAAWMWLTN